VIGPGVLCWAANNTNGGPSFNNNNGGPINWAGVNYPSSGTADGRYFALMNGTSAATPHVAGLAGLLLSVNPGLSNAQVKTFIEQTADKTGGYAYVNDGIHNNGTWHQEPGYGRINVFRALNTLFAHVATAIASAGNFGHVCVGSFVDIVLTINNTGAFATLKIANITSSSGDFLTPSVLSYPLVVNPGDSIDVTIRFQPTSAGAKSATISVISNDPASPHDVHVKGEGRSPRLSLVIANAGSFAKSCLGSLVEEPLILNNSGGCALSVSNITSSSPDFVVPQVSSYPLTVAAGGALTAPIRFQPTSAGVKIATLTVISDDPAGPRSVSVTGEARTGRLTVTGSTHFGGVTARCCADRTLSICNVGDCALHVTSVRFKRKSRHWKLLHNPFPAALHAGSCLGVVIQYRATEKCSRACELIIESDDPSTPIKSLDVLAYTMWDSCGCKDCCEDCRKGCCEKHHTDHCCRQGYPCCCEDDENEDED
jgi:hypothetical protein